MQSAGDQKKPRASLSRKRKALFALLALIFVYAVIEALGFAAFWIAEGAPFSPSNLRDRKLEAASRLRVFEEQLQGAPQEENPLQRFGGPSAVLHPFLGSVERPGSLNPVIAFLYNPDKKRGPRYPINEFGFVAPDDFIQKRSEGRVIIGITGGSVALAFGHIGSEFLASELKSDPRLKDKEFVFVPMGMAGWKQPQQLLALNYYLVLGGELDILINLDGVNEVAAHPVWNAGRETFPLYPTNWGTLVGDIRDPDYMQKMARAVHIKDRRANWANRFLSPPLSWSILGNFLWARMDDRLAAMEVQAETDALNYQMQEASYLVTGPLRKFADRAEMFEALGKTWADSSLLLQKTCAANGIRYFHFLQPNQYVKNSKPMGPEESQKAMRWPEPFGAAIESGYPVLQRNGERLKHEGVAFSDLTQVFAQITEPVYIDASGHLNTRGNEIVARAIADAIKNGSNESETEN
jgi:hypothetical protein